MKITGITKQGFHYSVDDAVGDDWELIEILSEMNNDEYLSVVPFAKKLLGNAQYERLKKFCRDKTDMFRFRINPEIKKQVEFLQAKCKKTSWTFLIQIKQ